MAENSKSGVMKLNEENYGDWSMMMEAILVRKILRMEFGKSRLKGCTVYSKIQVLAAMFEGVCRNIIQRSQTYPLIAIWWTSTEVSHNKT